MCVHLRSEARESSVAVKKRRGWGGVRRHARKGQRRGKDIKRRTFCSSNLREERQFYKLSNGTPH